MSVEQMQELNAQADAFYEGLEAYNKGFCEADCPYGLGDSLKSSWLGGHRSAKRNAEHPCLPVEEYFRIQDLAEAAYKASKISGVLPANPFPSDTEANDIWLARILCCQRFYGDIENDFVVLGKPTRVTVISEHKDGSVVFSIPARYATT